MIDDLARAFWLATPGRGEIRDEPLPPPGPEDVVIRAEVSAISRGTETLVFQGRVPENQFAAMRCPFQVGDFPSPVKYGYASVGTVEQGPAVWRGRRVFCLHPHQDRYCVPIQAVVPVPDGVPSGRAALAANMETAVNALWDAPPPVGAHVAVVGAGVIGSLVAALAGRVAGADVQLIDVNPARRGVADAFGVEFARPEDAADGADLVFHASGAADGLTTALSLAGMEARVIELSWYGTDLVPAPLGEAFHSKRLTIAASQVGAVAPVQRPRWSRARRLALALDLLADSRYDALLTEESAFADLPSTLARLAGRPDGVLCHLVRYP